MYFITYEMNLFNEDDFLMNDFLMNMVSMGVVRFNESPRYVFLSRVVANTRDTEKAISTPDTPHSWRK